MGSSVAHKLIASHLLDGEMTPGEEVALRVDQTLTQDATGTMVMLEFEALGLPQVRTELSAQYVDHNLLQTDYRNADDHLFLRSAARRWGLWFSKPGNGVSHPVHMQRLGAPGRTLLGSDSHTCAAGSLGMLTIGTGGLDVAMAMAGEPYYVRMPEIWGVRLVGQLPDWVSQGRDPRDAAPPRRRRRLRAHRRVPRPRARAAERHGPARDRQHGRRARRHHERVPVRRRGAALPGLRGARARLGRDPARRRRPLRRRGRARSVGARAADRAALQSRQGQAGREVAGTEITQALIGSSANPGLRDFQIAAHVVAGRQTDDGVSFDINPTSRQSLETLAATGAVAELVAAGARLNQAGCLGCIGVGQAPATGAVSLRTVPRNFPGRSGTRDDQVYLCSPETAAASALNGQITDPRDLDIPYRRFTPPREQATNTRMLVAPDPDPERELRRGPNIQPLPELEPLPDAVEAPVLHALGDDISTDEIMPAGRALSLRSNIPALSEFYFAQIDETSHDRAMELRDGPGHIVVGGENYGQGSSREHGALVPACLGLRLVIAKSFARIHGQNLVNFGILPLLFSDPADHETIEAGDVLHLDGIHDALRRRAPIQVRNSTRDRRFEVRHDLSERQVRVVIAGGLINEFRRRSRPAA